MGLNAGGQRRRLRDRARRARRGLASLFDTMLALAVMSAVMVWVADVVSTRLDRELMAGEVRAVSDLAQAGRLYVEADTAARAPGSGVLIEIELDTLVTEGLRAVGQSEVTPQRRRAMSLWLWRDVEDRILVIARARGDLANVPRGVPGAADGASGVGAILDLDGETLLRGPDLLLDTADSDLFPAGLARRGDLIALAHVDDSIACTAYLHRQAVPGCPNANTMDTDLDMGGHSITSVGTLSAFTMNVDEVASDLVVSGQLESSGLVITGDAELQNVILTGQAVIDGTLDVAGDVIVGEDVSVSGTVRAAEVISPQSVLLAGEVLAQSVEATDVITQALIAEQVWASGIGALAQFTNLVVETLYVGALSGPGTPGAP